VLDENCDEESGGWYSTGIEGWAGKEYLDQFFLRPADPEAFKPQ
jgi:ribose transport system substrate-binding protein